MYKELADYYKLLSYESVKIIDNAIKNEVLSKFYEDLEVLEPHSHIELIYEIIEYKRMQVSELFSTNILLGVVKDLSTQPFNLN